jgi:hypothetical protein
MTFGAVAAKLQIYILQEHAILTLAGLVDILIYFFSFIFSPSTVNPG